LVQPLWKQYRGFSKKLKIELPKDLSIPLLRIYSKEVTIKAPGHPCLFSTAHNSKLWKQSRYPTTDEWIKKMWDLYKMEFYSAIKKNEILWFSGKWMELENITLSKGNQTQKSKGCVLSFICGI
jgi:hypothetical protein